MSAETATDAASLRARLVERGYVVVPAGALGLAQPAPAPARRVGLDAWTLVERLVGERPELVEQQPIRAVPGGRSFASTGRFTPLHTDSQDLRGVAPSLQLLWCRAAADAGGETLLLDSWRLLERLERDDPELFQALFRVERRIPFYFGEVVGPTVARRRGHLVFTHSPVAPRDALGRALARWLERCEGLVVELPLRPGELLAVDNHRMLHGRRAFEDVRRDLWRVLAWLAAPLGTHARFAVHARELAGSDAVPVGPLSPKARVVAELLAGTPPGVLAAREGIDEAELYRWRNVALEAAARALGR